MVEFSGSEFGAQQIQWENEVYRELNRQERRQDDDRIERHQQLQRNLMKAEARVEQLQLENQRLRAENQELRQKYSKLEKKAPITIDSMKSLTIRHASVMLPRFKGSESADLATAWLKAIERSAKAFSWTEAETFLAASVALEDSARQWLVSRRRDITSWRQLKIAFKSRYAKPSIDEEMAPVDEL